MHPVGSSRGQCSVYDHRSGKVAVKFQLIGRYSMANQRKQSSGRDQEPQHEGRMDQKSQNQANQQQNRQKTKDEEQNLAGSHNSSGQQNPTERR